MAQANVKLTVNATQATSALKGVQNQTTKLQSAFGGLKTAIAGIGIGLLAKETVSTTANFQALQIRMKVLTSEFGEFSQAQELVTKAQNQFNLSIVEATKGITDIFARLRPLGVSLKDIETTFVGFNSIAKVAGLNATEASAAFTQLAQGLGSGRLQGDEFRSIAEQVPQLLKAISDETGIASGKLKDFASKGLLKSDIIIRALSKSAEGLGKQIKDIIDESPAEKFKKLNNELLELQLTIGSKLTPVLADSAIALANLVDGITKLIDSEVGQASTIIAGLALAVKGISVVVPFAINSTLLFTANLKTLALASNLSTSGLSATSSMALLTSGSFAKAALAANAFKVALAKTGIGLAVIAFGALTTAILKSVNAQKELNRQLDLGNVEPAEKKLKKLQERLVELQEKSKNKPFFGAALSGAESAELQALPKIIADLNKKIEETKELNLAKEFNETRLKLVESNKELNKIIKRSEITTEEGRKQFDIENRRQELIKKYGLELANVILKLEDENKKLEKGADLLKKKQEETDKLKEKMTAVGEEIESSIKDNLRGAITGAQSFGQAMTNVLNRIRDKIIDAQLDRLIGQFGENFGKSANKKGSGSGIGGFLGGIIGGLFANGGRPPVGKASIVGERGPELFVPKVAGNIIPNNKLGGGTTNIVNVSVDASGSSVQGSQAEGQALGQLIAAVVQTTLVQEQRAGGLLNR